MPNSIHIEMDDDGAVQRLTIDLTNAGREIKTRVADVMEGSGPTFVRTMKQVVRKDTGALERSMHYTVNRRMPRLRIGSLKRIRNPKSGAMVADYASIVHTGTSTMSPNPYMDIALAKHTTPQSRFIRGLRKAGVGNIAGRSTGGL